MFIEMDLMSWVVVVAAIVITAVYFFIRVAYIKSKGGNLLADLSAPYPQWGGAREGVLRLKPAQDPIPGEPPAVAALSLYKRAAGC